MEGLPPSPSRLPAPSALTSQHPLAPPRPACCAAQATDEAGERYELHPDGNSLDFFQGLVRKKLPA